MKSRVRAANDRVVRPERDYVLYWMTAARRVDWNFAMDRCVELSRELNKPVLVFEGLRSGYEYASRRLHSFVIDGMRDNEARLKGSSVGYFPYLEPEPGQGKGLLDALASRACIVVTDDFPAFMLPRMTAAAARKVDVKMEQVDSNGLLPIWNTDKMYGRAYDFRRYAQRELPNWLDKTPAADALSGKALPSFKGVPDEVTKRWPAADLSTDTLLSLPIDEEVSVVESFPGGTVEARRRLDAFDVHDYAGRNHPDDDLTSRLSAYLHFGHISPHEVFAEIAKREEWTADKLADNADGKREGWWGMSEGAESFLDQICTWREVGLNRCVTLPETYDQYESLPDWAQTTLAQHAADERPWVYDLETFERAQTHDRVWNAAQNQLRAEGRIHNYMRMLWGKKILHWSESPQEALRIMLHINDRWAIDGRDPNSISGILWILGAYDRAWGPERPIFGKIRYMTVQSAQRKLRMSSYLERWAPQSGQLTLKTL